MYFTVETMKLVRVTTRAGNQVCSKNNLIVFCIIIILVTWYRPFKVGVFVFYRYR